MRARDRRLTLQARIALLFSAVIFLSGLGMLVFLNAALSRSLDRDPNWGQLSPNMFMLIPATERSSGPLVSVILPGTGENPYEVTYLGATEIAERWAMETTNRLTFYSLIATVFLSIGSFGVSYLLARRTIQPVTRMAELASAIGPHDLTPRLSAKGADDELSKMAAAFNGMLDRLESSFTDLAQFNAHASHELRTSLAVIRTHLEVGMATGDHQRAVQSAVAATERAHALVEDMLAVAGRQTAEAPQPVDLALLAAEVVDNFNQPGRIIQLDLPPEGVPPVRGNEAWLQRAIANLVDNAFKYGPPQGPVLLDIRRHYDAVILRVTDHGPGIPPHEQKRIWERFSRLPDAAGGRGFGLGLAIVRQAVEAAGGYAWVDSEPGQGARFTLSLPLYTSFTPEDVT